MSVNEDKYITIQRALLVVAVLTILLVPVTTTAETSLPEANINKHEVQQIQSVKAEESHNPLPEAKTVSVEKPPENHFVDINKMVAGSHQDWMAAAGISPSDYSHVEFIISHESSWRPHAVNQSSGATGLCQALPAHKMQSAGSDYMTNPVTQLRWCDSYAKARYGGWAKAYSFWQSNRWW